MVKIRLLITYKKELLNCSINKMLLLLSLEYLVIRFSCIVLDLQARRLLLVIKVISSGMRMDH